MNLVEVLVPRRILASNQGRFITFELKFYYNGEWII